MKKLFLSYALVFNLFCAGTGEYDLVINSAEDLYKKFDTSKLTSVKICNLKIDNKILEHIMEDIIAPNAWWNRSKFKKICFENDDFSGVCPSKYRVDCPTCLLCNEELRFVNNTSMYWKILNILFCYLAEDSHQSCCQGKLVLINNDLRNSVRDVFEYYTDLSFSRIEVNENALTDDSIGYIGKTFHSKVKIIK